MEHSNRASDTGIITTIMVTTTVYIIGNSIVYRITATITAVVIGTPTIMSEII
jgi:hypothetical protein